MSRPSGGPWTARARIVAAIGLVVSALLVIGAWIAARSEDDLADEIRWLNLGVAGIVLGGSTVILWLLAGRRAVTTARNQVVLAYAGDLDVGAASAALPSLAERVTVVGSTWYHQPDCLLAAGKPLVDARKTPGLTACVVCGG